MSKGLKALERIERDMEYVTRLDFVEPIVRGEVQQELYKIYHREEKDLSIIEKELKALEIIKKKKVQVAYLHSMWDDFETTFNNNDEDVRWLYNEGRETNEQLTKEEYELLKEVLL